MASMPVDQIVRVLGSVRGPVRRAMDLFELRKPKPMDLSVLMVVRQTEDFTAVAPRHLSERTEYGPLEFREGEFRHYLEKTSHLVGRGQRPKYLHLIYELHSPHDVRQDFYPVIVLPGVLTSTNALRIRTDGGDFKVLDNEASLANLLARYGLRLFLANPPYCSRLDRRYVDRKLGIKNPFMPALCFDDLVRYLKTYIDFVTAYTGYPKVVLIDYSLGAMTGNAYAGSYRELFADGKLKDDRIAGIVNIAGPSTLADQPTIQQLRLYNLGAGVLPATPFDPLKFFGKAFVPLASTLAMLPQFVLQHMPVLKDLYDFENMDKPEAAALINLLNYGVEGITPGMLYQLVEVMAVMRGFCSLDGKINFLDNMSRIDEPCLEVSGEADTLAPEKNMRMGFDRIRTPASKKRFAVVKKASHLGILVRKEPMREVGGLCRDFVEEFGRVA
ncbi:MAG: hypothetical protein NT099_00345 [Candidatus Saganbacteria bacterium]|nr:hypothetical protein [Candidatus Saganbacteria bacterium]